MPSAERFSSKTHHKRPDLAGEHRFGDLGQLIFFFVFIIIWLTDSLIFHYSDSGKNFVPLYIRLPVGIIVWIYAAYLAWTAHNVLFKNTSHEPGIIKAGVFGTVRHPLYLGSVLFYLGLLILNISIVSFIIWLIIIVFYNYIARYEEKLLLDKFGDDYRHYMAEVPRWLPRIRF